LKAGFSASSGTKFHASSSTDPCNGIDCAVWFPDGGTIEIINASSFKYYPPAGWEYVGSDANDNLITLPDVQVDVACACDGMEGDGCDPFITDKSTGCLVGGCTPESCLSGGSTVKANMPPNLNEPDILVRGGFIKTSSEVEIAEISDLEDHERAFEDMYELPRTSTAVDDFVASLEDPTNGSKVNIFVVISGRIGIVEVSESGAINANALILNSVSCSCGPPGGSCTKKVLDKLTYCDNNCLGPCTLSGSYYLAATPNSIENFSFVGFTL